MNKKSQLTHLSGMITIDISKIVWARHSEGRTYINIGGDEPIIIADRNTDTWCDLMALSREIDDD